MRGIILGVGVLAMAGVSMAQQPAMAEDVYISGGRSGVAVGIDTDRRHHRHVERRVIRDRSFARGDCRTVIIKRDGYTKKIRRCD
jgi:hypothetical protein